MQTIQFIVVSCCTDNYSLNILSYDCLRTKHNMVVETEVEMQNFYSRLLIKKYNKSK